MQDWSIWAVSASMSSCLRAILRVKDSLRSLTWFYIGNGCHCSVWYVLWLEGSLILEQFSTKVILNANSSLHTKVSDFLYPDGTWNWPSTFRETFLCRFI